MPKLTVTDYISHPAKTVNEDLFGHNHQAVWIFDGATGIVKDTIPGAASDPRWLVETCSEELQRGWDDAVPTPDLLLKAAQNTITRYEGVIGNPLPLNQRPTACLAIARLWQDALEISFVGDCGIIHQSGDTISVFGNVSSDAHGIVRAERDRLKAQGLDLAELNRQLLPFEHAFRAKANMPGGYKIVDLTTRWANTMNVQTLDAKPGDQFLLSTDGLYRLVDVFGKYDDRSLLQTATERGLASLYEELRTLETEDAECSRYVRVKVSDDVAAALVMVE